MNPAVMVVLISMSTTTPPTLIGDSRNAALSRDGRFIVFESQSRLTADDTDRSQDIYLYDRLDQKIQKMGKRSSDHVNANPFISDNGDAVVFTSYSLSMQKDQGQLVADVYLHARRRATDALITNGTVAHPHDGEALWPQLAHDARFIVFTSNATNLAPAVKNPIRQVYLFDRVGNVMELVSRSPSGEPADAPVGDQRVSRDGRFVFFKTAATNILWKLPATNLSSHLYRVDRFKGTHIRVDNPNAGFDDQKWAVGDYTIDDEGRTVVFEGRDKTQPDPDKMLESTALFMMSRSTSGTPGVFPERYDNLVSAPSLSGNGRFLACLVRADKKRNEKAGLVIMDLETYEIKKVLEGSFRRPLFSADGRFLSFESRDTNVVPGVKGGVNHIYLIGNPFYE